MKRRGNVLLIEICSCFILESVQSYFKFFIHLSVIFCVDFQNKSAGKIHRQIKIFCLHWISELKTLIFYVFYTV